MTRAFFHVVMSLDGYIAPPGMDLEHATDPTYEDWGALWAQLHSWTFKQRLFRESLQLGAGGETGSDNQLLEEIYSRTGATILGKRMFDAGERLWPEEAPFHTPVYVVTTQVREPWVRPGGTTFYFVNDGVQSAIRQAKDAANDRDVRIGGGGTTIVKFLNAGLVDEFTISVPPVIIGGGIRLFEGIDRTRVALELAGTIASSDVTHLQYRLPRAPAEHNSQESAGERDKKQERSSP